MQHKNYDYIDEFKKAEYAKSYISLACEDDIMNIAEEGMEEYIEQLEEYAG